MLCPIFSPLQIGEVGLTRIVKRILPAINMQTTQGGYLLEPHPSRTGFSRMSTPDERSLVFPSEGTFRF